MYGEYDANGTPVYETVYLGEMPVGTLKQTGSPGSIATSLYNLYADHLGAPRLITKQADQAIVWRWDTAESFGGSAPDQNPNGFGTFVYNQRFPGQVFDLETGLFQNWHREYSPRWGRYPQPDPIGLAGGINTFAYVGGNPLSKIDALGLQGTFVPTPVGPLPLPIPVIPSPGKPSPGYSDPDLPPPGAPGLEWPKLLPDSWVDWIIGKVRGGKWSCTASCNVQQINPSVCCPDRVTGSASGPNEPAACVAAKRDATQSTPSGCYPRHCQCSCSKK